LYDVEQGRSRNSLNATQRDLTDYFLVPFEHCIKRTNVASIMCQYGAMEGIPSCANGKINNGVYRDQFNFSGYIVSDCDAVQDFSSFPPHPNQTQSAADGILGGLDVDCGMTYGALPDAIAEGLVPESAVRQSATRFYAQQIALGLLESTPFDEIGATAVDTPEHRQLAVDAAGQALVLLLNKPASADSFPASAPNALPLARSARLALIGPHVDSTVDLLGNYHGVNLQVLNQSIVDVARAEGLAFTATNGSGAGGTATAVANARAADVAVLFLGLTVADEGEGHDRSTLGLPQSQIDLALNVTSVQPYTVVVLINGGALSIEPLIVGANPAVAIIEAFYPGQGGARAILQALLGDRNTWGKLPYTVYPSAFIQRDVFNFDMVADGGLTYRHYDGKYGMPLFQFGHGLSYTAFSYAWAKPPTATIDISALASTAAGAGCFDCSRITFSATVTNREGDVGDAVILGFVTAPDGVRSLFDFSRVTVRRQASTIVTLAMDRGCTQAVSAVDDHGKRWMTPGAYMVEVGDIDAPTKHEFTVTGAAQQIDPTCRL
jgi:beta-D-xylosidase 4